MYVDVTHSLIAHTSYDTATHTLAHRCITVNRRAHASSSTFCVCNPLNDGTFTCVTCVYSFSFASSSSFLFLCSLTLTRYGTLRTPCDHTYLLSSVSTRTSVVPIFSFANLTISFRARGARFLNVLVHTHTAQQPQQGG